MPSMPRPFRSDEVTDAAIAWMAEKHQLSVRAVSSTYGIAPGTARKIVSRANPRRFTGRSYVPILTLSDLPSARRSWVKHHGLRWYSNRCEFHGCEFDQAIARISLHPCPIPPRDRDRTPTEIKAREGCDGRYHLFDPRTKAYICVDHHADSPLRVPRPRHLDFPSELVPENLRCRPELPTWPPADPLIHHRSAKLAKIYADLITFQGLACSICHNEVGSIIDHDHSTGNVRGLLCRYCNRHVDECLHLSVCPYAEYLNSPPVTGQIRHPNHHT